MNENNKELDEALRKIETRFRVETYLMRIGASEEAARLIASSPDQIKKFSYDGVDLRFNGSDLAVTEDPNAKAHFVGGPFKALFVAPAHKPDIDDHAQPDPALVAAARAGNKTAYSQLTPGLVQRRHQSPRCCARRRQKGWSRSGCERS